MKEHLIPTKEAETNLARASAYLAENIGSSDGHAEAMKEIVEYYTARNEVDLAAELADTIKDNFVRDNLLVKIAEKCAAAGDDEYAFQLAEAIEDYGLQAAAHERIAVQKAVRGEFAEALKITAELNHPDDALAAIAVRQMLDGFEIESRQTLSKIEYPTAAIHSLQTIAAYFYDGDKREKAGESLAEAVAKSREIELPEEKIRALSAVAGQYIEAAQFDKAIEVLAAAQSASEALDGVHREGFLSSVSLDFLRAGSLNLADRALDLIADKTQIAATLIGFSAEFKRQGETGDALETLEEAYAILKSQKDKEVRDSQSRFSLLGHIAAQFAALGKVERALEIASENPLESERDDALTQIAVVCAKTGNDEMMRQSIAALSGENARTVALINVSDAENSTAENDTALKFLDEAFSLAENVPQPAARSVLFNEITKRFFKRGAAEKARQTASENLQTINQIRNESHRVVLILQLAEIYENCGFELNEAEKEIVAIMLRKAEW
ncbi:MAG: hypothetical protein ACR2LT_04590 [Pyrinomonadaceae bacterium]